MACRKEEEAQAHKEIRIRIYMLVERDGGGVHTTAMSVGYLSEEQRVCVEGEKKTERRRVVFIRVGRRHTHGAVVVVLRIRKSHVGW
jgi:hypothetical protein